MKNVIIRSISGLVYIALIVGAIFAGSLWFMLLTALFAFISINEFVTMTHGHDNLDSITDTARFTDTVFAVLIAASPAVFFYGAWSFVMCVFCSLLVGYFLIRACVAITDKRTCAVREMAKSVLGVTYISLPLAMLNFLYIFEGDETMWLVLLMFVMIWLNDTGAFCFGSMLGRHRLCERLSPKKSWEGFWGGAVCCVVFGIVCGLVVDSRIMGVVEWGILGLLVAVFATLGDLFESMIKRTVKVKDAGTLIPGHGGILDRIDSLLFVAPITFILYIILSHLDIA